MCRLYAGPQAMWNKVSFTGRPAELCTVGYLTIPVLAAFHFFHIAVV